MLKIDGREKEFRFATPDRESSRPPRVSPQLNEKKRFRSREKETKSNGGRNRQNPTKDDRKTELNG